MEFQLIIGGTSGCDQCPWSFSEKVGAYVLCVHVSVRMSVYVCVCVCVCLEKKKERELLLLLDSFDLSMYITHFVCYHITGNCTHIDWRNERERYCSLLSVPSDNSLLYLLCSARSSPSLAANFFYWSCGLPKLL